jgi:hypothetical protein
MTAIMDTNASISDALLDTTIVVSGNNDATSTKPTRLAIRKAENERMSKANACWKASDCSMILQSRSTYLSPKNLSPLFSKRKAQSSRLRQMLKSDLRIKVDSPSQLEDDDDDEPVEGSSSNNNNNSCHRSRRVKLDEYQNDIERLLQSLQSTEFVGKIDPKYHSRYLSTPSF